MRETVELIDAYRALRDRGATPDLQEFLDELQPADLAAMLERLEAEERRGLLAALPPAVAAETLEYLVYDDQYRLLSDLDEAVARAILAAMSSDAVADLALAVHPRQTERLLRLLPEEHLPKIRRLMEYPAHSAGGRMTADYVAVRQDWPARRALEHFHKVGRQAESVSYVYVLDAAGHLVGVASLRDVILADPETPVAEFMTSKVVSIPATADQEEAARLLRRYAFLALPVVDDKGRMVGIITADDAFEVLELEATEDFQRIGGLAPVAIDYGRAGVAHLWRKRVGWLLVLMGTGLVSSSVIAFFEHMVEGVVALAFFIPMLLGSAGNTGTQSATLIIRDLATGQLDLRDWLRVLVKELAVGLLLGLTLGGVLYLVGVVYPGGREVRLVASLSMVALILWGNLMGALLPLLLTRLRIDPAVVSSPLITTTSDLAGLIIYFNVARLLLHL